MVNKIGLALSGGGFRATLYHLCLVRFLRDAGVLPSITHITAVSGGSICAAHLALNWDRYNASPGEFDDDSVRKLGMILQFTINAGFDLESLLSQPAIVACTSDGW